MLRGQDETSTTGISQLDDNLGAVEVAQYLDERRTLETDAHGLSVVVAGHALSSRLREVVVLGVQLQCAAFDVEANEIARIIGERLYAAKGCQQAIAVDVQFVGIVLRNDGVVVGITALNEAAAQGVVAEAYFSVALVEADDNVATVLA